MRDRLIELITNLANSEAPMVEGLELWADSIADYLLENGVIVMPCKYGDKMNNTTTDLASIWEKNMEHLKSGGFGPEEQPQMLLQYWKAQERAGYPYASENAKYFEEMVEKEYRR